MSDAKSNYANSSIAVSYVKSKMPIGASNKIGNQIRTVGLVTLRLIASRAAADLENMVNGPDSDVIQEVLRRAYVAECYGAGNCTEQAAVAFAYLFKQEVRPIDYLSHPSHFFVAVGRKEGKGIMSSRPETWNPEAYICDPWNEVVYPASEYNSREPNTNPMLWARAESILAR